MLHHYLFASALLLPLCCVGESTPTTDSPSNTVAVLCPQPNKLTFDQDSKIWSAPDGFKSFNTSFVTKISSFVGAQWSGAGSGQVFCVYSSKEQLSFPVVLFYNTIVLEPQPSENSSWNKKQGYLNCISHEPEKCAFFVRTKPVEETFAEQFNDIKPGSIENDNSSTEN